MKAALEARCPVCRSYVPVRDGVFFRHGPPSLDDTDATDHACSGSGKPGPLSDEGVNVERDR